MVKNDSIRIIPVMNLLTDQFQPLRVQTQNMPEKVSYPTTFQNNKGKNTPLALAPLKSQV